MASSGVTVGRAGVARRADLSSSYRRYYAMGAGGHPAGCTAMDILDMDVETDPKGAVMSDGIDEMLESVRRESEARSQALQRLLSAADSSAVFGQPVSSDDYTVIPAAEVAAAVDSDRAWVSIRCAGVRRTWRGGSPEGSTAAIGEGSEASGPAWMAPGAEGAAEPERWPVR